MTRVTSFAVGLVGLMGLCGPAGAVMVTPGNNPNGEPNLYTIMNSLYGAGNYTQLDSSAFTSTTNTGQSLYANYEVRYAADPGAYGVRGGDGTFHSIMSFTGGTGPLSSGGTATPASGSVTSSLLTSWVPMGGNFSVAYKNTATGDVFSSDSTLNGDGDIHVILFALNNEPGTFVGGWKDLFGLGDRDYNDAIIQWTVTAGDPPDPVPEPATTALLGTACLAFGIFNRKRKAGRQSPTP